MADVEKFLDAEADRQAELDELIEQNTDAAAKRMHELLLDTAERDAELFELYGAEPQLVVADLEAVPVVQRDVEWSSQFAAIYVAAKMQTWIEMYGREVLRISEDGGNRIKKYAGKLNVRELVDAGKTGIGKKRIGNARNKRSQASVTR